MSVFLCADGVDHVYTNLLNLYTMTWMQAGPCACSLLRHNDNAATIQCYHPNFAHRCTYEIQIHSSKNWLSKNRSKRSVFPPLSCLSLLKPRLSEAKGILLCACVLAYVGLLIMFIVFLCYTCSNHKYVFGSSMMVGFFSFTHRRSRLLVVAPSFAW